MRKAVTGTRQGTRYSVPNVEFHECPDCGERVYDALAIRQIEKYFERAIETKKLTKDCLDRSV